MGVGSVGAEEGCRGQGGDVWECADKVGTECGEDGWEVEAVGDQGGGSGMRYGSERVGEGKDWEGDGCESEGGDVYG